MKCSNCNERRCEKCRKYQTECIENNIEYTQVCKFCKIEKPSYKFYMIPNYNLRMMHCIRCHNSMIDERRRGQINVIVKKNLSSRIRFALKAQGTKKDGMSTVKLIGCSTQFLKEHLEKQFQPGMSWENYGMVDGNTMNGWHIDHILPCKSFDLKDPEQVKMCFHYTNLQPMWAPDNIRKGCKV